MSTTAFFSISSTKIRDECLADREGTLADMRPGAFERRLVLIFVFVLSAFTLLDGLGSLLEIVCFGLVVMFFSTLVLFEKMGEVGVLGVDLRVGVEILAE